MSEKPKDAVERAHEMQRNFIRMPVLAAAYAIKLVRREGGEALVAYAHYAQAVEGQLCIDRTYLINDEGREFFKDALRQDPKLTP